MTGTGHMYLTRQERAELIRLAAGQLEVARKAKRVVPVELALWEGLLLKLEGHKQAKGEDK